MALSVTLLALASPTAVAKEGLVDPALQRVDVAEIGVSASFPADWRVLAPKRARLSWYRQSPEDDTPVYAWTAVFAFSGVRWCGIDRYEDFPWSLDEHTRFLEHWHVSGNLTGTSGGYEAVELPSGHGYRIDIDNELTGRSTKLYLLAQDHDQVLLTCTDVLGSTEDWREVAESIELAPRTANAIDSVPNRLEGPVTEP